MKHALPYNDMCPAYHIVVLKHTKKIATCETHEVFTASVVRVKCAGQNLFVRHLARTHTLFN